MHCVADDIIVHGTDEADLHAKLQKLLQRCDEHGFRLNQQNCQFDVYEISCIGHVVTADELKPDPPKIEAVLEMGNPVDKEAVERLRWTISYLARFLPKLTDVFRPIALLAQRNVDWNCGAAQEKAFTKVKQLLTEAPTLA